MAAFYFRASCIVPATFFAPSLYIDSTIMLVEIVEDLCSLRIIAAPDFSPNRIERQVDK